MTLFLGLWLAWLVSVPLSFASEGCLGEAPLVEAVAEAAADPVEFRLPISSSHPEIVTAARVVLNFEKASERENWMARVQFSFPDPLPFGIPFTFQKFRLTWKQSEGIRRALEEDWSNGCLDVGRGLFPGQKFEVLLELPGTSAEAVLRNPGFELWGGRY